MTIEEMIKNGCTYDEAEDALIELWDKQVEEEAKKTELKEAEKAVYDSYKDYLKIAFPDICEEKLDAAIERLKQTIFQDSKIVASKPDETREKNEAEMRRENAEKIFDFFRKIGW